MARIVLSEIAKLGYVPGAKVVKPTKEEQEKYDKLVQEANERIRAQRVIDSETWFRAKNYRAK